MRTFPFRSSLALAGLLAGLAASVSPAQAAVTCAPDPYEKDTPATAAPLAVGTTTTRAICQEPTPLPRFESPRDEDYFVFTATGGTAYTVGAVDVGAALANDAFDRGGLQLAVERLNADGTTTLIEQNRTLNGDRVVTPVLDAGRYVVHANTTDAQIYPETNTMDIKTVQGPEGVYGVSLAEGAAAPAVSALSVPSSTVRGGRSLTATVTLSAPAPAGGTIVDVASSNPASVSPGSAVVPEGATRVAVRLTTRRGSSDVRVTLTASARVGEAASAVITVRR